MMDKKTEKTIRVIRLDFPETEQRRQDYIPKNDNPPKCNNMLRANNVINLKQNEINRMINDISSLIKRK